MWQDKTYYPGTVLSKVDSTNRYIVQFDDGNSCEVRETDIIVCDMVAVGLEVSGGLLYLRTIVWFSGRSSAAATAIFLSAANRPRVHAMKFTFVIVDRKVLPRLNLR